MNANNFTFSGHELIIIPRDCNSLPNEIQINQCLEFLKKECPENIIESNIFPSISFIDCGQNFESINCPLCNNEIEIEFWQQKMSISHETSNFINLDFITNCCEKRTNLNELLYNGDCGFAHYCLSINNLDAEYDIENLIIINIEKLIGVKVKPFWRHI